MKFLVIFTMGKYGTIQLVNFDFEEENGDCWLSMDENYKIIDCTRGSLLVGFLLYLLWLLVFSVILALLLFFCFNDFLSIISFNMRSFATFFIISSACSLCCVCSQHYCNPSCNPPGGGGSGSYVAVVAV